MGEITYRHDVDGLRAVAVILVLLFHLDVPLFSGGFTGVDIFFVISGFVIFRSVLRQEQSGEFSVLNFYRRRFKRIFPALAVTVLLCLCVGLLLMTPRELEALGYTSLAAIFAVSNIYFSDRLGYFAESVRYIPLIHTWSLGVEEQFYIIIPLLLLLKSFLPGKNKFINFLIVIFVVSFLYNIFAVYGLKKENHAFYLPMSRLWEIALGGLLAGLERRFAPSRNISALLFVLGLLGIAGSAVFIDTNTPFPGIAAMLPTGAAALVIVAAIPPGSAGFRVLASRPMIFYGKISYSLYLLHWPIIVFFRFYVGREFSTLEKIVLLLVATSVAAMSWRYIETPFRSARVAEQWRQGPAALASLTVAALGICAVVTLGNGLPWRFGPEAQMAMRIAQDREAQKHECIRVTVLDLNPKSRICSYFDIDRRPDYVLWGDSHAQMLSRQLSDELHAMGWVGVVAGMSDCPPLVGVYYSRRGSRNGCGAFTADLVDTVEAKGIPVVILASRWANFSSLSRAPGDGRFSRNLFDEENGGSPITLGDALTRTVNRLRAAGAHVVIVGPVPEVNFNVPDMFVRSSYWDRAMPDAKRKDFELRQELVLPVLAGLDHQPDVQVVYPHKNLCDDQRCSLVENGIPLYTDDDHLSSAGVNIVLPAIIKAILN